MTLSDVMRASSTGTGPALNMYGPSTPASVLVECTTAGTAETAVLKISTDGGQNYTTGIASHLAFDFGGYTFAWADNSTTIALAKKYRSTIGMWRDKSGNGYHHSSIGSPCELALGINNALTLSRTADLGASPAIFTGLLSNPNVRGQILTLNQSMSFFAVVKIGNINAPIYGVGTSGTNTPLVVRADTTSRIGFIKANVVGSSAVTAQTPASSKPTGWYFFGFTYGGGANLTYYDGMLGAGATAAWQSTSGTHSTATPTNDGVWGQPGINAGTPTQLAYCSLMTSAASAGDVSALKDSVRDRWGAGAVA
jgi:hypothetical protein